MRSRKLGCGTWLLIFGGAFLIGLLLAHGVWSSVSSRRLNGRVASLRQNGEPLLPADFAVPPDGPDNAAGDIRAASDLLNPDNDPWQSFRDLKPALPLSVEERKAIADLMTHSSRIFQLLDQASAKPRAQPILNLKSPILDNLAMPNLGHIRRLAQLLAAAALLDHEQGDDAMALQRIERIVFLSRYVDNYPAIVGDLVATGCATLAADRTRELAPDLRVGTAARQASPDNVRHLIDRLLDDEPPRQGWIRAMRGERMMQLDTMASIANGVPFSAGTSGQVPAPRFGIARYFLRPIIRINTSAMIDYSSNLIPISNQPNLSAARAKLPARPPRGSLLYAYANVLMPTLDRFVETYYRGMTERRLAATALAIRWYATEHQGKLPENLSELIPRYLPTVPLDPLAAGAPLKFIPQTNASILYSVGPNGTDEGGSEAAARRGKTVIGEWDMQDRVVHLTRQPRPEPEKPTDEAPPEQAPPATQPASAPSPGIRE